MVYSVFNYTNKRRILATGSDKEDHDMVLLTGTCVLRVVVEGFLITK